MTRQVGRDAQDAVVSETTNPGYKSTEFYAVGSAGAMIVAKAAGFLDVEPDLIYAWMGLVSWYVGQRGYVKQDSKARHAMKRINLLLRQVK